MEDHHARFVHRVQLVHVVLDHSAAERHDLPVLVDEFVEVLLWRLRDEHDAVHEAVGLGADAVVFRNLHAGELRSLFLHVDGRQHVFAVAVLRAVVVARELVHVVQEQVAVEHADVAPDVQVRVAVVDVLGTKVLLAADLLLT